MRLEIYDIRGGIPLKSYEDVFREKLSPILSDNKMVETFIKTAYRKEELDYIIDYVEKYPDATENDVIICQHSWVNDFIIHRSISSMVGLVVGDALGVPVEFSDRDERKMDPVTDMRGYGTHNQPPGTWSDDSSMAIATLDWLREFRNNENNKSLDDLDYSKLMDKFSEWMMNGEYTPYGRNFDIGIATSKAIMNYARGVVPVKCGGIGEYDNGNGSLLRILPAALFFHVEFGIRINKSYVPYIYNISSLTHGHGRSRIACLIYTAVISNILRFSQLTRKEIVTNAMTLVHDYLSNKEDEYAIISEVSSYNRLWDIDSFINLSENEIRSSGYVVDTLEAAIWCFLITDNYRDCVLKAVNLGEDTDTVGAVAGGLAGMYYGVENIPDEWINIIPKIDKIMKLTKEVMKMKTDYGVTIVCGDKTYNI